MSNISKCSASNGHAMTQAVQDAKTHYTKHPSIAPQFKNIPDIKRPWTYFIDNNKKSVFDSYEKIHHIPTECVSSFHETYEKTAEDISSIIGQLTQNDETSHNIPKINIAMDGSQITGEDNPYHIRKIGNYALERLNTKGETLLKTPDPTFFQEVAFFSNPINWFLSPIYETKKYFSGISGDNIYKKTEEYLLQQQEMKKADTDKKLPTNEQVIPQISYGTMFAPLLSGLSQPTVTDKSSSENKTKNSVPVSDLTEDVTHLQIVSPDNNQSINQEEKNRKLQEERQAEARKHVDTIYPSSDIHSSQPISDVIKSAVRTIQNGTTTVLKNTKYIGNSILKDTQFLGNLAMAYPLATTMVALGVSGLLYRNFKKKNEQDIKDEEK